LQPSVTVASAAPADTRKYGCRSAQGSNLHTHQACPHLPENADVPHDHIAIKPHGVIPPQLAPAVKTILQQEAARTGSNPDTTQVTWQAIPGFICVALLLSHVVSFILGNKFTLRRNDARNKNRLLHPFTM
jgi:hypothetical protein